jgi:asparagine N-glycosylation enzyme membrane subunit Stt3
MVSFKGIAEVAIMIIGVVFIMINILVILFGYPLVPLLYKNEYELTTNNGTSVCNFNQGNKDNNKSLLKFSGAAVFIFLIDILIVMYLLKEKKKLNKQIIAVFFVIIIYFFSISMACFIKSTE